MPGSSNSSCRVGRRFELERCFARLDDWVDVGTEGKLFSYTVTDVDKSGERKETPTIIAAVRIADGIIAHRLGERQCQLGCF